jgi:hypothetical protein
MRLKSRIEDPKRGSAQSWHSTPKKLDELISRGSQPSTLEPTELLGLKLAPDPIAINQAFPGE